MMEVMTSGGVGGRHRLPQVVNVKVAELRKHGVQTLKDWLLDPNHLYIGRSMCYVEGATSSKWRNPYPLSRLGEGGALPNPHPAILRLERSVKVRTKYSLEEALELYEKHVRENLWEDLEELEGKVLGCWCAPQPCHGNVLQRLYSEKMSE